jgi:hypothetical protein
MDTGTFSQSPRVMIGVGCRVVERLINETDRVIASTTTWMRKTFTASSDREEQWPDQTVVFKPHARFSALRWSPELNPVKVRVEATSAFKQLTLIDHARGRGAVGELANHPALSRNSFSRSPSVPGVVGSTTNIGHSGIRVHPL